MNLPDPTSHSSRRQFIKHFALGTAASFVGGKLWTTRVLADVTPSALTVGRIPIKLSDYPVFLDYTQNPYPSVRFSFTEPFGAVYPFALTRVDETIFYAVDTKCSHAGCIVNAFDDGPSSMLCECHGSEYNAMGEVLHGPAAVDLSRYETEFDGDDTLTVLIPGLDMTISSVSVQAQTAATVRLKLQFPTYPLGRYRIHFRQNLTDEPIDAPFSTSPTGPLDLTQITCDGQPQTVYVEAARPQGFFSVALFVDPFPF